MYLNGCIVKILSRSDNKHGRYPWAKSHMASIKSALVNRLSNLLFKLDQCKIYMNLHAKFGISSYLDETLYRPIFLLHAVVENLSEPAGSYQYII